VPEGSTALVTPFENPPAPLDLRTEFRPMLWQAEADMRFRMPEGGVFTPGPSYSVVPPVLPTRLASLQGSDARDPVVITLVERQQYLRALRGRGVKTVIVGPSPGAGSIISFFSSLLERHPDEIGDVAVWWNVGQ
jgi:hypothetical protein